jgi:hypothetical protein
MNESDCAHASGCHSGFTSEEACDSACCASHFDRCLDGATANCDGHRTGTCSGACAMPGSTCTGSLVHGYSDDGCCPLGCIAISQCEGATASASAQCQSGRQDTLQLPAGPTTACDPGDLSHIGPEGCPML